MARRDDVADLEEFGRFAEPALLILVSLADGAKHGVRDHRRHRLLRWRSLRAGLAVRRHRQARIAQPHRGARDRRPAQSVPALGGRREGAARAARQHAGGGEGRPEAAGQRVTWLIRLYPPAWRRRYGRELEELIALREQPLSRIAPRCLVARAGALQPTLHVLEGTPGPRAGSAHRRPRGDRDCNRSGGRLDQHVDWKAESLDLGSQVP